ncbi:MAG: hypothetical protein K9N06_04680 [Candidatus Cloacimonetes bacterium]|nr:hypothetical protein [Candidatus Cloacimonadota bacterium]
MKKYIFCLLLIIILLPLAAEGKSAGKAMLFSALVPGSGQAYLGYNTKAGIFLATELLTLGAAIRLNHEVDWVEKSYEQYALNKANVPLGSDKEHYQLIQNYISSEDYNQQMRQDAWSYFVLYYNDLDSYYAYVEQNLLSEDASWDWETTANWQEYRSMRRERQNLETYSNLAVAAVVLNHLVGLIDTALTGAAVKRNTRTQGNVYVNPDFIRKGMSIGYAYKF